MKIGHDLFGKIFDKTLNFIKFLHEQGTFYKILFHKTFYKINLTENFTVNNRHYFEVVVPVALLDKGSYSISFLLSLLYKPLEVCNRTFRTLCIDFACL